VSLQTLSFLPYKKRKYLKNELKNKVDSPNNKKKIRRHFKNVSNTQNLFGKSIKLGLYLLENKEMEKKYIIKLSIINFQSLNDDQKKENDSREGKKIRYENINFFYISNEK
jgi:hypothetical protein